MDAIMNTSLMSQARAMVAAGESALKMARQAVKGMGQDGRFFRDSKRGEAGELQAELCSTEVDVMKDAVKKVIAAITVGKDMNSLFPHVVNCMRTDNVEVKKLVYLYLINYAKSNPDLTIMAVNAFVKDSEHASPLIRALAIRTMGCIRVEKITEYLTPPLKKALRDEDPYVRKTAALCVAKLHDISPTVVRQQGFIEDVKELLSDANPTVVANAVAALNEITEASGRECLEITPSVLSKLLAALNECTEWGQVFILDSLSKYAPSDAREAENIIERVAPRLVHQNPAVVLSACKIILMYMELITSPDTLNAICRKLAPPLVTLAGAAQPEVQYVALRNINLIVQRRPNLLSHKVKVFFCKYNDPIYVKMEKLDILVKLVNDKNVDSVLLELKEYASEVDVEYVRRAVRTIGRCAIKLEEAAEKCIKVLLQLIQTKVNYVVQEAIVVIKDIFRRYPNRYEAIISVLCSSLDSLDEPEAKASMIWIIGEYAERISNAGELLQGFLDSFHEETTPVQLQMLTAVVKLFLKKPDECGELVQATLSSATEKSDNPDLRDRGYIYWRLLSTDPEAAKAVILAERPVISDDTSTLDAGLLDTLTRSLATLASVYHKPTEAFVRRARATYEDEGEEEEEEEIEAFPGAGGEEGGEAARGGGGGGGGASSSGGGGGGGGDLDLLGLGGGGGGGGGAPSAAATANVLDDDFFGGGSSSSSSSSSASAPSRPTYPLLAAKDGIAVHGAIVRRGGLPSLEVTLVHESGKAAISACMLKIKPNAFGVGAGSAEVAFPSIPPTGASGSASIPLAFSPAALAAGDGTDGLSCAMRENASMRVMFFTVPISASIAAFFSEEPAIASGEFVAGWREMVGAEVQGSEVASAPRSTDVGEVKAKLAAARVHLLSQRPTSAEGVTLVYLAARGPTPSDSLGGGTSYLVELTFKAGVNAIKVLVKTRAGAAVAKVVALGIAGILKA